MMAPLRPEAAPQWLRRLVEASSEIDASVLRPSVAEPPPNSRRAAVLVLFGEDSRHGPDVLLIERASTLRNHAGQAAFPGGQLDPSDPDVVACAVREAAEETGLDPHGVVPLSLLPELYIPRSAFAVTPVLAHWARPSAVRPVDPRETAAVLRVPLTVLADPANRLCVTHPNGTVGPAFRLPGLLVWGFTGGLLSALLRLGGWAQPWDESRVEDLDEAWSAARSRKWEAAG